MTDTTEIPDWVNNAQRPAVDRTTDPKKPNYFARKVGVAALAAGLVIGIPAAVDIAGPKSDRIASFSIPVELGQGPDAVWNSALKALEEKGVNIGALDAGTVDALRTEIGELLTDENGTTQPGGSVTINAEDSPLLHRLSLSATSDERE